MSFTDLKPLEVVESLLSGDATMSDKAAKAIDQCYVWQVKLESALREYSALQRMLNAMSDADLAEYHRLGGFE